MGALKPEIKRLLNEQVNREFFSAYLYLDFSNYYTSQDLNGFANWFLVQAQEERDHAILFVNYLHDNDELVVLDKIPAPGGGYTAFEQPLLRALEHEQGVTGFIHAIYGAAMEQGDYRTTQFLDWFIMEQREEEKSVRDLNGRFRLFGGEQRSLYMLDSELGARVYTPAAPGA